MELAVGHQGYMHQGEYPAEQQRDGQYDEEVAGIDTGGVGREEDRQEGDDGNQRGT